MFNIKKIIRILLHSRRRPFLVKTRISKIIKNAPEYKIHSLVKNKDKIFMLLKDIKEVVYSQIYYLF